MKSGYYIAFHYFCPLFRINKYNMFKKISVLIVVFLFIYACSSSEGGDETPTDTFDRSLLLTHLADNIIIPSFQDFKTDLDALQSAGNTFTVSPNQTNLDAVRASWLVAYKSWQTIEMFDIGKAEELQYSFFMNIFPLTVSDVESNITKSTYDLNNSNNHDAQGFPALDYLLYGVANSDENILAKYTTDTNAAGYKKYVTDVLSQMTSLTNDILNDWTSSYRDEFIANNANTSSSSLNKFTNDYIEYYERKIRANKFGIPAGIFSSSTLFPEKVEGFYSKEYSKELALSALTAFQDVFQGKYKENATASRSSFQQYLVALDRADIATAIINQLAKAEAQINTINSNLYQQVIDDNTQMTRSYDELQKAVTLLKVDMASALNISIVFRDADGD